MIFNIFKMLAVAIVAVPLFGCSSPVLTKGSFDGLTNSDPSKGTIFVYRESSFAGAANQYDVLMDGLLVGSAPNGSFFSMSAAPGEKYIKADTGSFGKGSTIVVEKNKIYCLKVTLNFCVGCKSADITPVTNDQCQTEIKSLSRVALK